MTTINSIKNTSFNLSLTSTTNQLVLGTTNTTTISSVAPGASRTYTIQDAGSNVDILTGTYNTNPINLQTSGSNAVNIGTGTYSGTMTLGNASSSLAVAGSFLPVTAGSTNIGSATKPFGNIVIGTSNVSNLTISPDSQAAARTYTIRDAGGNSDLVTSTYNFGAMNFQTSGSNAVNIGTGSYSGTVTLGNASANIQVAGNFSPVAAGSTNVGTTTIPFGQLILGSSSSNYIVINPASVASAVNYTLPDTGQSSSFVLNSTSEITLTSQAIIRGSTYVANNAGLITFTLPASASQGDTFTIIGKGAGLYKIAQNAGQLIHFDAQVTTTGAGGSIQALGQFAVITVICITANTTWSVMRYVGNFTVT